ncbi:hypothetical protein DXU07_07415 [Bradyrhizobium elkanii]|nr:hypothetical protein [Bradyrhizobium brasilense]NWL43661.1 hypothetical protein [Bradyrhizobium elkanii]QOZ15680.1 hypothetical protein XI02_12345 [Bradyrhizobium sp. CCBAU 21365]NWL72005.1 hypothetical protein [Bradyrhizobium elkanii]OIM95709.1 hypothetical protein BLN97_03505 [Bradyrhizobium elkanii]
MTVPFNELPTPKLRDRPIRLRSREAACIGDVLLHDGDMKTTIVQQPTSSSRADKKGRRRFCSIVLAVMPAKILYGMLGSVTAMAH